MSHGAGANHRPGHELGEAGRNNLRLSASITWCGERLAICRWRLTPTHELAACTLSLDNHCHHAVLTHGKDEVAGLGSQEVTAPAVPRELHRSTPPLQRSRRRACTSDALA